MKKKFSILVSLLWALGIIIYFCLGIFFDLWDHAWVIFPIIIFLSVIFQVFLGEGSEHNPEQFRDSDVRVGVIWIGAVCIYLCLGFFLDLWHPGWIIFLLAVIPTLIITNQHR